MKFSLKTSDTLGLLWGAGDLKYPTFVPSELAWVPRKYKIDLNKTKFHKKFKLVDNFAGKVTLTVVASIGKKEIGFSRIRLPFMFASSRPPDLTLLLAFDILFFSDVQMATV